MPSSRRLSATLMGAGLLALLPLAGQAQEQPAPPPAEVTPPPAPGAAPPAAQRLDTATQANVQIRRAEPQVTVQPAQPQVQLERVAQEPKITVERMSRKEATLRDAGVATRQDMVGLDVVGAKGGEIGNVRDLLLSPDGQTIQSVVVEANSGFLGMNERLVAVPWAQVQVDGQEKRLRVAMADDQVKQMPEFTYEQPGPAKPMVGKDGKPK